MLQMVGHSLTNCSLEPGYYKDGAFGIRIEDILIVRNKDDFLGPPFGGVTFREFETITMVFLFIVNNHSAHTKRSLLKFQC